MSDAARTTLQENLFAAASGDANAWRSLVDAFSPRVFALLRSQCSDPDLSEEITQSTFCTVAAKLQDYTELGRFEAWLFRIAMNRLRDEMRRRKRQAVSMEHEALIGVVGQSSGASDEEPKPEAEDLAALRHALSRLPEADQEVVRLRHFGGLSFKQISELLDQPLGTVLARQHRALQKLAELMKVGSGNQEIDGDRSQ